MPRYESNQTIITFIRRLGAQFSGFSSQLISMPEGRVQMSLGHISHREEKISLAIFTRPFDKQDCIVLSLPLFQIPDTHNEELFGKLLYWNHGSTESVHFAVDELLNTINVVCFRTISGFTFPEFQLCIDNLISVARNSSNRLVPEFGLTRLK